MALKSRTPGESDKHYVSVVSNDDFQAFQQNGYHDDEDIDFSPQNGYYDQEEEEEEPRTVVNSKAKKTGAPKVDLMGKIAAAGSAIKNAKLPSPGELKEGYLNSAFHKSLHQPLMVKAKVEKSDVQKARQALTQEKSPAELGNIDSLGDIPIPTVRKSKQPTEDKPENESEEQGMSFGKSFMEKNIVTAVKENVDPEKLERYMTLTKTKTPAELAQINSLSEFPVPEKIKNILNQSGSKVEKESKKRRHSDIEPKSIEPFSMYSTLPRSLRETKLVTNVKVEEDEETLLARKAMVESKSPAELSAIKSLSDLPIPSRVSKIVARNTSQPGGASETKVELASNNKSTSKVNINDMYSTLPKSLKMELAVSVKVNKDPEEVERRKKLCQERTPMELGNIGSLSELPIPAPIQNFFSKSEVAEKPDKPKRKSMEEKRKRNLTTGTFLTSDFIPESWKETKLLVRAKVEEDEEVLKSRQQLVETKTPAELGQINGLSDFPVPTRLQTLGRSKKRNLKSTEEKEMSKRVSGSAKSLPDMSGFTTLPSSMKCELLVTSKIEDPEIVARNKEIVKNKSVHELSQIRDISDFPVPDGVENFFKHKQQAVADNEKMSANGSSRPTSPQSFKESIYSTLPRSLKEQQLIVKSKLEDPEKVRERQEIVRTMSPTELSQISSISDLPIPSRVENMLKRKSEPGSPVAPPRKWKTEDIYESLPGSLKSELVVRTREMEDPEELERRREMIRTQTPAQLSEIRSISDLPVPKFIEKIVTKSDSAQTKTEEEDAGTAPVSLNIFSTLPASLKDTKLLVKAECEDPEVQAARAEVVKSKSVNELSQITSLSDVPIPEVFENMMKQKKSLAPAERKKKFKDKMRSQSTTSLSQSLYGSLPRSLKQDLIVKSRVEDPDVLAERRAIVASKSVSELSQITSLSDFPVPKTLSRAFHKSLEMLASSKSAQPVEDDDSRPLSPGTRSIQENLYASLPRSLKSEILVKSCVEDPSVQLQNMELTQSKSVSELAQIKSIADFPIPDKIERLISRSATNTKLTDTSEQQSLADSRPISRATTGSRKGLKDDIYASLPRSLKDQLIVRTKVEENEEVLAARQALVESKSPVELSEIHSLAEMPIPSRIEAWLHGSNPATDGSDGVSPMTLPRNKKELTEAVYRTLPPSLVQPCVVRSKVEDPTVLLERQQLQQSKSIHELSKIRNLNEMPIPGNVFKLPDVPLPKAKTILNYIARPPQRSSPRVQNGTRSETYHSYESAQSETPVSTPGTEEKVFTNKESPEIDLRYESVSNQPLPPPPAEEEEEDHFSLADQIRATPERNLRGKKNKKNRRSHEIHDEIQSAEAEEVPPPLPPKKLSPSPKKGMSLEKQPSEEEEIEAVPVKGVLTLEAVDGNIQVVKKESQNKFRSFGEAAPHPTPPRRERQSASNEPREITEKSPLVDERIQARPLPAPPAPPRNMKKKSASIESEEGRGSRNSDRSCGDVTNTENFRTCADTLNTSKTLRGNSSREEDDITLAESVVDSLVSCAETLVGENDNLETCVDTLTGGETEFFSDDDDNPYPSVNFDRAGASIVEDEREGRSLAKKREVQKSESGRRLEEGTQQLSMELMQHVESLKTTLDNMSNRLGTRSRSRSHSKTRASYKDNL